MSNSAESETARREREIQRVKDELPAVGNALDAFGRLLIARSRVKETLPDWTPPEISVDPDLFRQGAPMVGREVFAVSRAELTPAADIMLPAAQEAFPNLSEPLGVIHNAARVGEIDWEEEAEALLSGIEPKPADDATEKAIDRPVLEFAVGEILKPFAEKRAEALRPLVDKFDWHKGYCPVCGSWPHISFLTGQTGERRLKCSFCGHQWRFMRTQCPFCETTEQDKLEFLSVEDRPLERAELCHACKRYIVGSDLRDLVDEVDLDIAALGMIYLDLLAQDQGFRPGAMTEWNSMEDESEGR